jgi:hypothetical protein
MISGVPRAEKRFMSAMRIWISAVYLSGYIAMMRSPKALRQRIFASMRLRMSSQINSDPRLRSEAV